MTKGISCYWLLFVLVVLILFLLKILIFDCGYYATGFSLYLPEKNFIAALLLHLQKIFSFLHFCVFLLSHLSPISTLHPVFYIASYLTTQMLIMLKIKSINCIIPIIRQAKVSLNFIGGYKWRTKVVWMQKIMLRK